MLIIWHICETLWNFHNHLSLVTELLTSLPVITWLVNSWDNPGDPILQTLVQLTTRVPPLPFPTEPFPQLSGWYTWQAAFCRKGKCTRFINYYLKPENFNRHAQGKISSCKRKLYLLPCTVPYFLRMGHRPSSSDSWPLPQPSWLSCVQGSRARGHKPRAKQKNQAPVRMWAPWGQGFLFCSHMCPKFL